MMYKVLEAITDSMKMQFPKTPAELDKAHMDFARLSHKNIFSGCVGCVDGMLVRTITPRKNKWRTKWATFPAITPIMDVICRLVVMPGVALPACH